MLVLIYKPTGTEVNHLIYQLENNKITANKILAVKNHKIQHLINNQTEYKAY